MQAIIFEDINEKFGYGMCLDFKVIIMKSNGYINATNMLKTISSAIGKERKMKAWKQLEHTPEYIEEVELSRKDGCFSKGQNCPSEKEPLIIRFLGGNKDEICVRGQYVHPELIIHVAFWASSKFALKVVKITLGFVSQGYKREIEEKKQQLEVSKTQIKARDKLLDCMDEIIMIFTTGNENEYYISRVNKCNRLKPIKKFKEFTKVAEIPIAKNSVAVVNQVISELRAKDHLERDHNTIKLKDIAIQEVIEEINKVVTV